MATVRSNHQPTARVATEPISLWDLLLLHQDPIDFAVVLDQAVTRLGATRATESPLQGIENIFESVVNIMDEETLPLLQEEQHDYLEGIGRIIADSGFLRGLYDSGVDRSPPLPSIALVAWEDGRNRVPSLSHHVRRPEAAHRPCQPRSTLLAASPSVQL
jgi:hypothetical protein